MALTSAKKALLNRMNSSANKAGLGTLLGLGSVVAAGSFTTAGGDATESITSADVAVGDLCFVTNKVNGATPRTVLTAEAASGAITVTMSGDPSTDHVLQYLVIRVV